MEIPEVSSESSHPASPYTARILLKIPRVKASIFSCRKKKNTLPTPKLFLQSPSRSHHFSLIYVWTSKWNTVDPPLLQPFAKAGFYSSLRFNENECTVSFTKAAQSEKLLKGIYFISQHTFMFLISLFLSRSCFSCFATDASAACALASFHFHVDFHSHSSATDSYKSIAMANKISFDVGAWKMLESELLLREIQFLISPRRMLG